MDYEPDKPIWKSYVWHDGKCYFVSTIDRTYVTYEGTTRGFETLAWEYDWINTKRGELIYQAGGLVDHQQVCRCLIAEGMAPDEDNPRTERFTR